MTDDTIIYYYNKGFSIDYITKWYYKYLNRNNKPVVVNGVTLYPAKLYKKHDAYLYVNSVIYRYILDRNKVL